MGEILFPRGFFFVFWRRARKQGSFDPGVKLSCGDDIPADRLTDFNCSREIIRFRVKSGGGIVGQREFPVTLLRIFTGGGGGERRRRRGCIVSRSYTLSNFTRFEHKRKHCYRCSTRAKRVVVAMEYPVDNLRYKLRFVNRQTRVHLTEFPPLRTFSTGIFVSNFELET